MPLPQDRLTKLIHESELDEQLNYEMERARRYEWDLGLILVVPRLPENNADMMYPALKRLALACSSIMRVVDRGIRWGNGIFFILPETPAEGVDVAARKIQEEFERTEIAHPTTGETFLCGMGKSIRVYNGKHAKANPGEAMDFKQMKQAIKEGLE
ncbi:MAG: hypothetical protein AB7S38_14460 [Vulcanimicrobiota bacterium]|nr:hypothetical protein [Candidatus Eremiobacteraeota bacterium]